jgi:HD-GYP domain-containing protein (c-di-GMP phosphodiesterase class II)
MQQKAVAVADLQFGMYIKELDRPWIETPFAFQGFWLRTEQQLQALRKLCKHVIVDAARSEVSRSAPAPRTPSTPSAATFEIRGNAGYKAYRKLRREIQAASDLYSGACNALAELLEPLERGQATLDGGEVQRLVNGLADSVIRNPDALLLLSKVREAKAAAHARALQVSVYMMVFGRFLQREPDDIRLLGLLGLLQDLGNARVPAALLQKHERLTAEESEIVKRHVELSGHIVGITKGLPPRLDQLVLLHHERQDGTGYPRGLRGYQIGLHGSIAAICDAYEMLLAPPPYGEGKSAAEAVTLLIKERGTAFHGPLLEQFVRCMGAFPVGSEVELTSGEFGVVIGEHISQRLKPKVMVLLDDAGKLVLSRKVVDLAEEPDMRIRRTLEQGKLGFNPRRLF